MGQEYLFEIALTGRTFSTRPSKLLGLTEPSYALNFDIAAALMLVQRQADYQPETREPRVEVRREVLNSDNFSDFASRFGGMG